MVFILFDKSAVRRAWRCRAVVARLAHNQEVAGSSPVTATKEHSLNQVNKDKPLQGVVLRNRTLLAVLCESLSRPNYSKPPTLVGRCIQRIVFCCHETYSESREIGICAKAGHDL